MHDDRPVIITSISPVLSRGRPATHDHGLAYQAQCLRSWIECGAQVISVNNRVEIAMLDEDHREVEFRGSTARRGAENPKGLPLMSELLEIGRQLPPGTPFGIVNFLGLEIALRMQRAARHAAVAQRLQEPAYGPFL